MIPLVYGNSKCAKNGKFTQEIIVAANNYFMTCSEPSREKALTRITQELLIGQARSYPVPKW